MRFFEEGTGRAAAGRQGGFQGDDVASDPGALSAGELGSSGGGSRPGLPKASEGRQYVKTVLEHYLWLPGTPRETSRLDRRCAQALYRRGVALDLVRAALTLGAARRAFRRGAPLPGVRALHYFLPVVEELEALGHDPAYVRHLERKLEPLTAGKASAASRPP